MDEFETHFGVNKDVAKGHVQYDTIYVKSLNISDTIAICWLWSFTFCEVIKVFIRMISNFSHVPLLKEGGDRYIK